MKQKNEFQEMKQEDVFGGFDKINSQDENAQPLHPVQNTQNRAYEKPGDTFSDGVKTFFADKGAETNKIIFIVLGFFAVILIFILPQANVTGVIILAAIVNVVRENKRISTPALEIDTEQGILTITEKKYLFDEIKSWNADNGKNLVFFYLPANAQAQQKPQQLKLLLKTFKSEVKEDMLKTLEKALGKPQGAGTYVA